MNGAPWLAVALVKMQLLLIKIVAIAIKIATAHTARKGPMLSKKKKIHPRLKNIQGFSQRATLDEASGFHENIGNV